MRKLIYLLCGIALLLVCLKFTFWGGLILHISRWFIIGILIAYAIFSKQRFGKLAIVTLIVLIGEFAWYNVRYQPESNHKGTNDLSIRSYNLLFSSKAYDANQEALTQGEPDILLVQEFTPRWRDELAEIKSTYPYQYLSPVWSAWGLGIYSKHPIKPIHLQINDAKKQVAQLAEIDFLDKKVLLVNAHYTSPALAVEQPKRFFPVLERISKARKDQWRETMYRIEAIEDQYDAVIVGGDLNLLEVEGLYREMRLDMRDAHRDVGQSTTGFSFPNLVTPYPFMRIDYFMYRGEVEPIQLFAEWRGKSDHYPLYFKVRL